MSDDITTNSSILIIDDSMLVMIIIQNMLRDKYDVRMAQSAELALGMLDYYCPDIILLDIEMPKTNGFEFLEQLKMIPGRRDIPVIFLTGTDDRSKEEKALCMGAVDYMQKPISAGVLKKRIQMHLELSTYHKKMESLVDLRTKQLVKTQDLILDILANVTTYRDDDTGAHIMRTYHYSKLIVEKLFDIQHPDYAIDDMYAHNIIKSTKLHDIGKIAISDNILRKRGQLSPLEYEMIKMHTVLGAQMIDSAINDQEEDISFLLTAKEIILHHHEWWDGRGYPSKLKGREIPLSARVMAIADVYDALISDRPYKKSFLHEDAIGVMKKEAGTHFDAGLMVIVESLFSKFKEIAQAFQDE